ncbi:MAG: membrane protein insertase YidC [Alphaproteobacteria bacterium]|nr:membrane protein insertase YidC [Alphaproteobacteria bacterium]MBU1514638.1 membrane protein insertase YidC [Alphaproteobacteria bacterium]MBU2096730.1 membrane protein insertase YidC [Alphaproteobacteria bacterium]MBU2150362.1 membrane protein insertase YidC [Alphaproteobacteria bacterium]MBU2306637.1 membrane protein insertase YidC [Alphaproteobacteria bacterium]
MRDDNTRNTIIFFVCAALLLLVYQVFVIDPQAKRQAEERARQAPAAATATVNGPAAPSVPLAVTRQAAIAAAPRVPIATPALKGSLSLRGARIDDLYLVKYRETLDKDSPPVELLRPEGTQYAQFTDIGWTGANVAGLPGPQTVWTLSQGSVLAPGQPVTLTYSSGQGLTFTRVVSVDDKYMFTVTDTVANTTAQPITLAPFGSVQRQGIPATLGKNGVVHEGGMGWLDKRRPLKYAKWQKDGTTPTYSATGGWIGMTDHYWLTAVIPAQNEQIQGQYRLTKTPGLNLLDANYVGQAKAIGAGRQIVHTTRVFAGAKQNPVLKDYQAKLGIAHLDEAIDWGMLWFITRPIFQFLSWIYSHVGNFGVAILLLTVVVRAIFFPLANKQYESMTKMKKVQPAMEELRKKFKDDPAKQQQELLALYQREKVNPLAGCLPIFLQIPVFFALFKTLQLEIDMRHAPFIGYIKDLSARDPTTIWNLFGLIPWDPSGAPFIGAILATSLHIGILPILYGATTWLTTSMSPPAPDPMQQRIFQLMPLLFTFIMAQFAIGLLVYYTWSNLLTAMQQYVIMRRFKVDNPIDKLIARITGKKAAAG